jgi:hypothetical protein
VVSSIISFRWTQSTRFSGMNLSNSDSNNSNMNSNKKGDRLKFYQFVLYKYNAVSGAPQCSSSSSRTDDGSGRSGVGDGDGDGDGGVSRVGGRCQ